MELLGLILIGLGALLYFIGEGATEGYTFATNDRRKNNGLIKYHFEDPNGILGYHGFRVLFENFGMILIIIGFQITNFEWVNLLYFIGVTITGVFIYERVFNFVSYGKLFPQKSSYQILKYTIPRNAMQDIIGLIIGLAFLILFILN